MINNMNILRLYSAWRVLCIVSICCYTIMYYQYFYVQEDSRVAGWEPNIIRDTRLYIRPDKNTSNISASELCQSSDTEPILLLVIVCSSVQGFDRRKAIRETWASDLSPDVRVAFLLGITYDLTLQALIAKESESLSDVIQEGFLDSYNNLTLKSVMMLKWVQQYCGNIKFLMKTDDDTFCNLYALLPLLRSTEDSNKLIGWVLINAKPVRQVQSKFYMPFYMYQETFYPNYISGSGYIMSRDVITALYLTALQVPLIHLEDVYITGICAAKAGIHPTNYRRFISNRHWNNSMYCNRYLTGHRLSVEEFHIAWNCVSSDSR